MKAHNELIETLKHSKLYQHYERAFTEATGLPLTLRAADSWQLPHFGRRHENPFCSIMAQQSRSCAACLQVQGQLSERATHQPQTLTCPAGLSDTAVPVRLGEKLIGFLQTGQILLRQPDERQFGRTAKQIRDWGLEADLKQLRSAFFKTKVIGSKQYRSVVRLLAIFAEHLSLLSNRILLQQQNTEPPVIARVKAYIEEHQAEELSLGQVAKVANMSSFYFCKQFKKFTGLNFTEYLGRARIEKSKNLLLNPNLRISEIAYAVGFQSLTHFNRIFKKITGQSPTEYRLEARPGSKPVAR